MHSFLEVFVVVILLLIYLNIADCRITVCKWNKQNGICIPSEDCPGKSVEDKWTCGWNVCCINPTIFKEKCNEFRTQVYGDATENEVSWNQGNAIRTKIVGGVLAENHEYPHMAAVGFELFGQQGVIKWMCGGAIISLDFVISAAHCFKQDILMTWVKVGTNDVNSTEGTLRPVSKVIRHPNYVYWNYHYDIALLHLETPLEFCSTLHPICFLAEEELQLLNASIAAGWGKTDEHEEEGVIELRKVELNLLDNNECKRLNPFLWSTGGILPSMICADSGGKGRDTCQGDSGGPLFVGMKDSGSFSGLIGLTSVGVGSCGSDIPSIYTRTSYFLSWIATVIWPDQDSQ